MVPFAAPVAAQEVTSLPPAVFLIHHPGNDATDPFGSEPDIFAEAYAGTASTAGAFDYPTFVVDGVLPVRAIPNDKAPMDSVLAAYATALHDRGLTETPVALHLLTQTDAARENVAINLAVEPTGELQRIGEQELQAWIVVAEDNIHYKPPAPVSNGIENHRFTVRAHRMAGNLTDDGHGAFQVTIPLEASWDAQQVHIVAWIQADGQGGRFQPHEVVQAVQADLDDASTSATKVVLAQLYSATWCPPCLFGDLAVEELAIRSGAAQPAPGRREGYVTQVPLLATIGALAGAGLATWATRKR